MSSERQYVDLILDASSKYPSWDPEVPVEVGDWGRITTGKRWICSLLSRRRGIFLKEGNIYKDGLAEEYDIPPPMELGREPDASQGVTWIVSKNGEACALDAAVDAYVLPPRWPLQLIDV